MFATTELDRCVRHGACNPHSDAGFLIRSGYQTTGDVRPSGGSLTWETRLYSGAGGPGRVVARYYNKSTPAATVGLQHHDENISVDWGMRRPRD